MKNFSVGAKLQSLTDLDDVYIDTYISSYIKFSLFRFRQESTDERVLVPHQI